jgi:hypothetical protein
LALERILRRSWLRKPPKPQPAPVLLLPPPLALPAPPETAAAPRSLARADKAVTVFGKGYARDAAAAALGARRAELR